MKHFTKCLKFLLPVLCFLGGVISVWADSSSVTASKVTSSSASWTGTAKETWSVVVSGGATNQNVTNGYAQVGTKNSPSASITFSTSGISGTITSIVVNCASYSGSGTVNATVGGSNFGTQSQSIPSWSSNTGGDVTFSGSASGTIIVTMTNGSGGRAMYIKSITVTYSSTPATTTAATPAFTPTGGSYDATKNVEITTETEGATIYYTTDGTIPNTSSSVYSSAISVSTNTTIKAIAVKVGYDNSEVASATYTFKAATPTFSPAAGTYDANQSVEISTTTEGATIYYTTDGSTPTTSSSVYSSAITVDANQTLKAIAVKSGLDNSDVATAAYEFKVAAPTFSPAAGTYDEPQNVTITTATVGANIYYTTDGSTPTASSTAYSSAIPVSVNTTLKAIAIKDGLTNSDVSEAAYVFKVAAPTFSVAAGKYTKAQTVELSTTTDGATIYYRTDGYAPTKDSKEIYSEAISVTADMTIKAVAVKDGLTDSDMSEATYDIKLDNSPGTGYFEKVTDASTLAAGDNILLVNETAMKAMSATQKSNNRDGVDVAITSSSISSIGNDVQRILLQGKKDSWYFYTGSAYLYAAGSGSGKNYLRIEETKDDNAKAKVTISSGDATITFQGTNTNNLLKYNSSSTLFSCYSSGQEPVQIYKEMPKLPVTIGSALYTTYCPTKAVTFDASVTAYVASVVNGEWITLTEVSSVPAETPVIVGAATSGTYTLNLTESASAPASNLLRVSDGTVKGGSNIYALAKKNDVVGFYVVDSEVTIPAGKCYLQVDTEAKPRLLFNFGEDVSGIKEIATDKQNDGAIYNLSGQRVNAGYKGIVIKNGKKYLNK